MTGPPLVPMTSPAAAARWRAPSLPGHDPADYPAWPATASPAAVPPAVVVAFAAGGVGHALAALNARTGCRYTALFRYAAPVRACLVFFDRTDPAAGPGDDLPVSAVYAVYLRRGDRPFVMADALAAIRADHPGDARVRAYLGVPVRDRDGRVVGGLCHFDPDPQPGLEGELDVMEATAAALFGRRPGAGHVR